MLTRYKNLYNALTHSTAFSEKSSGMDNSKINKKTFTPHNLKAIMLGANAAVVFRYTTNNVDKKLVEYIPLSCGYINKLTGEMDPVAYSEVMKENKGMIDALLDGLKFNYVEEIFFFTGDFAVKEDFEKEKNRLYVFANDTKTETTMKRLKGVAMVDGSLTNAYANFTSKKSIDKQLKEINIPFSVIKKFSPQRTELGLLPNVGLDSGEYEMDKKFSPDLDDKERGKVDYRLSAYFYEEEHRAIKEKKRREEEAKKLANKLAEEEINEVLQELWLEVAPIYTELYRNSVEQGCKGILVPSGYIGYKDKKLYTDDNPWVKRLYSSFEAGLKGKFEFKATNKMDLAKLSDLDEFNYFSKFHALNAFGIMNNGEKTRKWERFFPDLEKRFKQMAYPLFKDADKDKMTDVYALIKEKMTNCIVIESYDRSKIISLKYKLGGVKNEYTEFFDKNSKQITSRENCKIINDDISENNVISFMGVFDAKKFAAEALFSYQAYEKFISNGGKVGLDQVIIGRRLNGSNEVFSLKSNDTRVTAILAGSGSGKGVMTLGLLSAIVANKAPFIYLDFKPDMAEMLWNIEKDFKQRGITRTDGKECRILAIDSKSDMNSCSPVRGHRFGENCPDYFADIPNGTFSVLPYLKLLQLYYLLGSIRANVENKPNFGGPITFAILDEFQMNIKDNLSKLITTLQSEVKIAKEMKDDNEKEKKRYVLKIMTVVQRLASETDTFINTDGRKSQCRAIYLGQNADYDVWKSDPVDAVKNLSSAWYSKTSFRFFGRNCGTGSYAPAKTGAISEFVDNKETFGYWTSAIGAGKVDKIKDWPVFKAYSVLNENDFNADDPSMSGRCTTGVLDNIQDENVKADLIQNVFVMDDGQGNKIIRPEVGFLGLIRKLSGFSENELADALSEGYEVIWKVMCKYGLNQKYPDIETYLFDTSLESIYTLDEIRKGVCVDNEVKQEDKDSYDDDELIFGPDDLYRDNTDAYDVVQPTQGQIKVVAQDNTSMPGQVQANPTPQNRPVRPVRPQSQPQYQAQSQYQVQPQYQRPMQQNQQSSYTGHLRVDDNPFEIYDTTSNYGSLLSVKEITRLIQEDIERVIGNSSLISDFRVTRDGVLVFNGIAYMPQFDDDFLNSLPLAIKGQVMNGQLVELFDLGKVYKFSNLTSFVIENETLAQGRARKEMGIGFRKRWSWLFKKFTYLQQIVVGDKVYTRENPDSDVEKSILDRFKNNPLSTFSPPGSGLLNKVWDSKPTRAIVGAIGWTAGVWVTWTLASLLGPWGLIFGAIATGKTYQQLKAPSDAKELKKLREENQALKEKNKNYRSQNNSNRKKKNQNNYIRYDDE